MKFITDDNANLNTLSPTQTERTYLETNSLQKILLELYREKEGI